MADTSSPVVGANGTTIPVDGFTQANGDVRQAMVLGDAVAASTATVLADGSLRVYSPRVDGERPTFSGSINPAAVAGVASGNDAWVLQNPANSGKTLRVVRISWALTLATAAMVNINLTRRSSLNTGGTVVAGGKVGHDPADPASVVTTQGIYTVTPTGQGTLVGVLKSQRYYAAAAGTVTPQVVEWTFAEGPSEAIVLPPGTQLGMTPAAAFGTAPTFTGDVEWTEQ